MKTRALGIFLMTAGACAYSLGCSSSNNNGTGGQSGSDAGTGGKATGGAGGTGTGGTAGTGAGGTAGTGAGGRTDAGTDAGDANGDAVAAATFTDVFAILSNITTPTPDTAPGCANCHDGILPDGGMFLPHGLNFKDKATAFSQLVGVTSLRCGPADGSAGLKRIEAGNPVGSVLVQKVAQGLGIGTACDGVAMPINRPNPQPDGGPDAGDAGPTDAGLMTHYMVTPAQLQTIQSWVSAGALNN